MFESNCESQHVDFSCALFANFQSAYQALATDDQCDDDDLDQFVCASETSIDDDDVEQYYHLDTQREEISSVSSCEDLSQDNPLPQVGANAVSAMPYS